MDAAWWLADGEQFERDITQGVAETLGHRSQRMTMDRTVADELLQGQ